MLYTIWLLCGGTVFRHDIILHSFRNTVSTVQMIHDILNVQDGHSILQFSNGTPLYANDTDTILLHMAMDHIASSFTGVFPFFLSVILLFAIVFYYLLYFVYGLLFVQTINCKSCSMAQHVNFYFSTFMKCIMMT